MRFLFVFIFYFLFSQLSWANKEQVEIIFFDAGHEVSDAYRKELPKDKVALIINKWLNKAREQKISVEENEVLRLFLKGLTEMFDVNYNESDKTLVEALSFHSNQNLTYHSKIELLVMLAYINEQIENFNRVEDYISMLDEIEEKNELTNQSKRDIIALKIDYYSSSKPNSDLTTEFEQLNKLNDLLNDSLSILYYQIHQYKINKDFQGLKNYVHGQFNSSYIKEKYDTVLLYTYLIEAYKELNKYDSTLYYVDIAEKVTKLSNLKNKRLYVLKEGVDIKLKINESTGIDYFLKEIQKIDPVTKKDITEIVNRENEVTKKSIKKSLNWWVYIIGLVVILITITLVSVSIVSLRKKNEVRGEEENKTIQDQNEIEEKLNQFVQNKGFLDRNVSQQKIIDDYAIKNINYLSAYVNTKYKKNFATYLNDLRVDYFIKNYKDEFEELEPNEIYLRLGFGSIRTFRDYIKKKYGKSLPDWINWVKENS